MAAPKQKAGQIAGTNGCAYVSLFACMPDAERFPARENIKPSLDITLDIRVFKQARDRRHDPSQALAEAAI
ncbi:hypothetical protein [Terriglobus roseus]|uniref:hypothetical protein n=1 Tax=Terriglobus roseus TaxID=392734 RepID=UPI001BB0D68B|nr:hypothetical protein [Terriglobus roseus]